MKKPLLRKTASQKEDKTSVDSQPARDDRALLLPIACIVLTQNPRTDLGDLTELKDSIVDRGILNPLLVAKTAVGFELLGGHRRLECAKQLGLTEVPCRVVKTEEPDVIKLLDNIIREDLAPQDECLALKRLLPAFDGNKSALARALAKSPSYVNRAIKAADLIEAGLFAGEQKGHSLSKSALLELAMSPNPKEALAGAADGKKESIRRARAEIEGDSQTRRPSGALPGGRAVAQAVQFRERRGGASFTLRVHFDEKKTAPETKVRIISQLEEVLRRLRGAQ